MEFKNLCYKFLDYACVIEIKNKVFIYIYKKKNLQLRPLFYQLMHFNINLRKLS